MSSFKYQVSIGAVRKANDRLVSRRRAMSRNNTDYNGIITARVYFNGVMHEQELSKEKIKEAYTSSLKKYAKKL